MKIFLAYGALVNPPHMKESYQSAELIGTGTLKDWRLMFKGDEPLVTTYATIEEWEGYSVPFVLWRVSEEDEEQLADRAKHLKRYHKRQIEVEVNGEKYKAFTYVKDETLPVNAVSQHYTAEMYSGYKHFGFDKTIIDKAEHFGHEHYIKAYR